MITADGTTPTYDQSPSESAAEVAAEIVAQAEEHAARFGAGEYTIDWQRARKERGPAPAADKFKFTAGDPTTGPGVPSDSNAALITTIEEQRKQIGDLWTRSMLLFDKCMGMVTASTATMTALAGAWSSFHEARAASTGESAEVQAIASNERMNKERIDLAKKALAPIMAAMQGRRAAPVVAASGATPEIAATPEPTHAIVHSARRFAYSINPTTADAVAAAIGFDVVSLAASSATPADVCGLVSRIADLDPSALMQAAEFLSPEQCDKLAELQTAAAIYANSRAVASTS